MNARSNRKKFQRALQVFAGGSRISGQEGFFRLDKSGVLLALAFLFATLGPNPVFAQSQGTRAPANSLDRLSGLLKSGDRVSVTDTKGHRLNGTVTDVSASSLGLRVAGIQHSYSEAEI